MLTELTGISVKTDSDILRLHQIALQVAGWAGLSVQEQICFAVNVSNHYFQTNDEGELVVFTIHEDARGHSFLRAEIKHRSIYIEKELSGRITKPPPLLENTAIAKNEWEKYRDMQQFTFALSHDLKNSLTKLKLALSLLEEEEIPDQIHNYIRIIHRSADRLQTMMLSLNKIIEVGDASPGVVRKISPAKVFAEVYEEFAESIHKAEATVIIDLKDICEIHYIEVFLKSIFSNLLSNALKYSSPDRRLHLSVTASRREDNSVVFTFSDNGQGIDLVTFKNKLFMPFTRFSNKQEGSGLGLYLIKNIVERNGGKIEASSTPGEGTTFQVTLREYKLPSLVNLPG